MRFVVIGALNSVTHYLVFLLLFRWLGSPLLLASAAGYLCGLVNSYLMNRRWTFRVNHRQYAGEFARFLTVNAVSLVVNLLTLKLAVDTARLIPEVAQVLAIGGALLVNFTGNKWWTFRRNRS